MALSVLTEERTIREIQESIRKRYPDAGSNYDNHNGRTKIIANTEKIALKPCSECGQLREKIKKLKSTLVLGESTSEKSAWIVAAKKFGLI